MEKLIKSTSKRFTFLLLVALFGLVGRSFAMDRASDPARNPEIHQEGQKREFTELLDSFTPVLKEHFWPHFCAADLCRSVRPVCCRFNELVMESDEIPLVINHYDGIDLCRVHNFLLCYRFLKFIQHVNRSFSFLQWTGGLAQAPAPVQAPAAAAPVVAAPVAAPVVFIRKVVSVTNELEKTRFLFGLPEQFIFGLADYFPKYLIYFIDGYFKNPGGFLEGSGGNRPCKGGKKSPHKFCCPLFERDETYRNLAIMGMDFAKLVDVIPDDEVEILFRASWDYWDFVKARRRRQAQRQKQGH